MFWSYKAKTYVVCVWKWRFPLFFKYIFQWRSCNYLLESKTKFSKLFKFKVCHWRQFRKWFSSYPEKKQQQMFGMSENSIFHIFGNFWVTELKVLFGKARQNLENYLSPKFVMGSILVTLKSKTNILGVWKWRFLLFCKFLSDRAENIFWDSKAKPSKLLNSKVFHMKCFRKSLSSYLEVKSKYS